MSDRQADRGALAPLRMTPGEMRGLGYRAVDELVGHLAGLREAAVARPCGRAELERMFATPFPEGPGDPGEVLATVFAQARDTNTRTDHPRFFAYVPGPSNYVSALAEFVAAGLNVHACTWVLGPGAAVVERRVVGWLREVCGLPEGGGGLLLSGGTMASLVAVHAARVARPGPAQVVYVTAQTHAAIRRGLRFLGFAESRVRWVGLDADHRMDPRALARALERDRAAGRTPCCVIATAGTTSTGAVDPLEEIAGLCERAGSWLHVDGAYGAAAALAGAPELAGLDRADSIALDPHKWLFQPYESGCLLVRDERALPAAYALNAEYLRETRLGDGPVNLYDHGPELSRGFRALKLWMSLRVYGVAAFRDAIAHGIALARHAEAELSARPAWEVVTPARLGIVTFRPRRPGLPPAALDALTRAIAVRCHEAGFALVLTTELAGRPVLRLCAINPETTPGDVTATLAHLESLAQSHPAE
ncbi:pyridoxal phosphate-dependent decarboxylase family protein [Bailinhaonella thermotolerans]|uniref:Aminotransferase class V-fold PLP-dependent enzyme n=1 Tax=Bailinhaonella thermotolerans TaxID=1070861 RepID=A0A3A4A9J9_9ACTN|nr:aminotransferase class V-fold PLP-dependent enzyme [Bailinhaonella thermotolerans]RJL24821.1 aminotransferase class V-fold PLP-dependent enzyme [Bailinhaonella thermotolerans]